jgi:hypothetical protein
MKNYLIVLPNIQAMIYGINPCINVMAKSKKEAEKLINEYLSKLKVS